MKFHKRVPSFSFTSFTFNNNTTSTTTNEPDPAQAHSQPSSPSQPQLELPEPPSSAAALSSLPSASFAHHQQHSPPPPPPPPSRELAIQPRNGAITLLLSPDDPLQFIVQTAAKGPPPRKRSGSLIEHSLSSPPADHPDHPASASRRRSSFAESASQALTLADRGRIASPHRISTLTQSSTNSNSTSASNFTRHRKRLSNLFSPLAYYSSHSRSPSPAARSARPSRSSTSLDPESDRESNPDSAQIDLPSSSEDESESNQSNSDQSSDLDPELSDPEAQTILANTNANASSITPIDYLQKSNQPIPFIDQAPNITSPPPLPISFAPTDPRSLLKHPPAMARKTSISSRPGGSIRRRSSLGPPRQDLKLTVSRPIYQKNRCTITIEHGDWLEAAKKAERTRFYLVACDLSDESKYAIEWTIGTVLRQGDECLVIMVIETDSKFDPEDGPGTAADRTAKIRNQKDRQEKATLLVREVTALLERTGLHAKVTCQAIHGKNPRHMLVDCIDFLEPNLVIVGRRGVTSSKGSLMGSVSHYLVQKSSVPVMVARRRLRTLPKVYKKKSGVVPTAHQQRKLNEAAIENALPPSTSAASSFAQLPSSPDSKRLSVVSEETEKLNLLGLRHASPEPSELVEDGEEGEEDQATQEDHQEPGRAQEPRDGQSDSDGKEERPDLADQDVSVPMPRQTDEGARPADPVVTPHPVSIVEPVI
ncbi:hypothetical protein, variant [Puccinia triticina 1-1 BBBD Race 1]|uniref:Usp domain-containing protein n=1 Tax=Puccinia triticina (isolate 1-1 / race 1 (BBBD)) TaxID=630390 RepID=A0A180GL74_PUCT1|nr:hypothetical protein PTTG_00854 [Puccinia triticina 1-1 BBBD Race 1]OAV93536.1 hypothetical protein, variant [Puccinia triticina 1-1 BBBD Race 1]